MIGLDDQISPCQLYYFISKVYHFSQTYNGILSPFTAAFTVDTGEYQAQ